MSKEASSEPSTENGLILRDHLAIERTVLANERTFLAYVRTALTFLAVGGTLLHLFASWAFYVLAAVLLVTGLALLAIGVGRFLVIRKRLRGGAPRDIPETTGGDEREG
ncbi:MAG: YidH family protein [Candidatus Hydrogenedentota bacterium]